MNEAGLWKRHFHWSVLLQWEVLGWILAFLLAIGGILLVFDQYWWANASFIATSVFVFAKISEVAIRSKDAWWHRMIFTFVLFGVLGVIIVESVKGVNRWAMKHGAHAVEHASESKESRSEPTAEPQVAPAHPAPQLKVDAYIQPGWSNPYPPQTILGGIVWNADYVDVRLDLGVGTVAIQNLDFEVALDTSIAGVGQISQFAGVTSFPGGGQMPSVSLEGTDDKGRPITVPILPTPGLAQISQTYRVHCNALYENTVLHLVMASVALNKSDQSGGLPQRLFAPRRVPRSIKLKGTFSAFSQTFPLEFEKMFDNSNAGNAPNAAAGKRKSKPPRPSSTKSAQTPLISQSNSGGINIQQTTLGNQSPIINSPITVGNVPRRIAPSDMNALAQALAAALNKSHIRVAVNQTSNAREFANDFCSLFKTAGWPMEDAGVSEYLGFAAPGQKLGGVTVIVKGEPLRPNEPIQVNATDPLAYVGGVLDYLKLPRSLRREQNLPDGLIQIQFEDLPH